MIGQVKGVQSSRWGDAIGPETWTPGRDEQGTRNIQGHLQGVLCFPDNLFLRATSRGWVSELVFFPGRFRHDAVALPPAWDPWRQPPREQRVFNGSGKGITFENPAALMDSPVRRSRWHPSALLTWPGVSSICCLASFWDGTSLASEAAHSQLPTPHPQLAARGGTSARKKARLFSEPRIGPFEPAASPRGQ